MKSFLAVILSIIALPNLLSGQDFNLQDFLNTAFNDPLVLNVYDQTDFLKSTNLRTPNINEVEIRTRSQDLDFSIDDVRLRLTLTNFGEIREGSRYNDLLIESYSLEYNVRLHLALVDRYNLAIEHLNLSSEIQMVEQQKFNIEDQIKVEKADILYGRGDISDLTKLESDYTNLIIRGSNLQNRLSTQEGLMLSYYSFNGPVSISADSIANPVSIKEMIDVVQTTSNPDLALKEQEIQLGLQETELETKEGFGDFGYFQAEYDRNPDRTTMENFGYQLGFNLPITNPDRSKIQQNKLKNIKQQQSLIHMLERHEREMDIIKRELIELIGQYQFVENQYLEMVDRNKSLSGKYLEIQSILKMQENELRLKKTLAEQYEKILSNYLNWLDISGTISQAPLKNYLYARSPVLAEPGN